MIRVTNTKTGQSWDKTEDEVERIKNNKALAPGLLKFSKMEDAPTPPEVAEQKKSASPISAPPQKTENNNG